MKTLSESRPQKAIWGRIAFGNPILSPESLSPRKSRSPRYPNAVERTVESDSTRTLATGQDILLFNCRCLQKIVVSDQASGKVKNSSLRGLPGTAPQAVSFALYLQYRK